MTVTCLVPVAGVEALAICYSALSPELRPLAAGAFVIMAMILVLTGIRTGYRRYWAAFLLMAGVVAAAVIVADADLQKQLAAAAEKEE